MYYLVHARFDYTDVYFQFQHFEYAEKFCERLKFQFIPILSNCDSIQVIIEVMTEDEFSKKISDTEGD